MKIEVERAQGKILEGELITKLTLTPHLLEGELITKLTLTPHTLVDSMILESFLEELLSVGEDMPKQERKKYREKGRRKAH